MAKYLPEFGWDPVIITPQLPGRQEKRYNIVETYYPGDVSARLKERLRLKAEESFQKQIKIPRTLYERKQSPTTKAINLIKAVISYPDEQKGWLQPAIQAGTQLLNKQKFDAILSSSAPQTCHLIANALKSQHDVIWIADFRDLWTQNHYYSYIRIRRILERRLELKTMGSADALVTVSEPLAEELSKLHIGKLVVNIPNGYDPDEVVSLPLTKQFTITHTGTLYQGKRDPALLFRAIYELISEGKIDEKLISVRFFGAAEYWLEKAIKKYNLNQVVNLYPQVSREIALNKQRESQLLLLLNWDDPNEMGVYTGKLFEYLAARRPILAVGNPRSVISELLKETGSGIFPSGYEELKQTLENFYNQYKLFGYVPYNGIQKKIEKYSHKEMAKRFALLMENLCEERR
ncbi:MAG: glycosyltransferase [Candidatus Anstonellales archaeon]